MVLEGTKDERRRPNNKKKDNWWQGPGRPLSWMDANNISKWVGLAHDTSEPLPKRSEQMPVACAWGRAAGAGSWGDGHGRGRLGR